MLLHYTGKENIRKVEVVTVCYTASALLLHIVPELRSGRTSLLTSDYTQRSLGMTEDVKLGLNWLIFQFR